MHTMLRTDTKWVSMWLLFKANLAIFSAISWREQVNFQWDDDEVCSVLDQHAQLDFYMVSSLKQQSMSPNSDTLSWCQPTSLFSFSLMLCAWRRSNKYQFYRLWLLPDRGSNPRSTTLTITPPKRLMPNDDNSSQDMILQQLT